MIKFQGGAASALGKAGKSKSDLNSKLEFDRMTDAFTNDRRKALTGVKGVLT